MISVIKSNRAAPMEFCGLSTDTKPDATVNSLFLELDTGDFYYLETPAHSGEEDLIPQMSFTGEIYNEGVYVYMIMETVFFNEKITVIFDGQKYNLTGNITEDEYAKYGLYGEFDDAEGDPLFDVYPFAVNCVDEKNIERNDKYTYIFVPDDNEHTIEVSAESAIPAVWEKVGSKEPDES